MTPYGTLMVKSDQLDDIPVCLPTGEISWDGGFYFILFIGREGFKVKKKAFKKAVAMVRKLM